MASPREKSTSDTQIESQQYQFSQAGGVTMVINKLHNDNIVQNDITELTISKRCIDPQPT